MKPLLTPPHGQFFFCCLEINVCNFIFVCESVLVCLHVLHLCLYLFLLLPEKASICLYVCCCIYLFPAALSEEKAWTPSLDRPWGFPHITEHSWCTSAVQLDLKTSPQPLRCSFFAHRFVSVQRGCRKSWQMILLQCCFRWHNIILHPGLIDSNHPWPACTCAIERSFKFSLAVVPNITNTSDWDPDHRVGLG